LAHTIGDQGELPIPDIFYGKTQNSATCLSGLELCHLHRHHHPSRPSSTENFHISFITKTQKKPFPILFKPSRQKFVIAGERFDTLKKASAVEAGKPHEVKTKTLL